jgi:hypothetical protein
MFDLYYKKNDNQLLFKKMIDMGVEKSQNYIPLYKQFFSLNQTNYKNLNLNHRFHVKDIKKTEHKNKFQCKIGSGNIKDKKTCFFKFSPLLDPVKYLTGKYSDLGESLVELPNLENKSCHKKVMDPNNAAYTDSFFYYLSSMLLNQTYFPHGIDFYGSFLGIQKEFVYNLADDLDFLHDSTYFHKHQNKLYSLENADLGIFTNVDTRNYKKKLDIGENVLTETVDNIPQEELNEVFKDNTKEYDVHYIDLKDLKNINNNDNLIFKFDLPNKTHNSGSTCSSRTSNTENDESEDNCASENDESENDESDNSISVGNNIELIVDNSTEDSCTSSSDLSSIMLNGIIYNFPIQMICLECLDNTLDSLMTPDNELSLEEWRSCLFQVIMILNTYQKVFHFTHNDLHTNNIMFVQTDKKFIYYRFNEKYYKVPTYGRLYKIIDFGRAIYHFKGQKICSDSYHKKGDAATQYNCEPYLNVNKPRLEPNYSFDLCRLGCSLYDYFIDEDGDEETNRFNFITKLVIEWITDDKGRNILYKKHGEERYPDFKLYKMIARTVHNHTPEKQLNNPIFSKYQTSRKKIGKKVKVVNIDKMIDLTNIS